MREEERPRLQALYSSRLEAQAEARAEGYPPSLSERDRYRRVDIEPFRERESVSEDIEALREKEIEALREKEI